MTSPFQTARILWLAMLVAVGLYAVVLAVLIAQSGTPIDVTAMCRIFMVLVLGDVVVIYVLRQRLPLAALGTARPGVDAPAVLTTYVTCWALSEAVALFGLVLGFLGRSFDEAGPFFIVAAALLLWQRPRAAHFAS